LAETLSFVSALSFWPMAFQDVLRLNTAAIRDATLSQIARHQLLEDRGHDRWFVHDLMLITGSHPDLTAIFSVEHRAARDAAHAIVSESFNAHSDIERIVLLLTVESTGEVFFPAVVDYLRRMGAEPALEYFSQKHLAAERGHELVEESIREVLTGVHLDPDTRLRCLGLINRCYAAFAALFDALEQAMDEQPPTAPRAKLFA
jgi:hypothetical protein